jgi:hypothetical protein
MQTHPGAGTEFLDSRFKSLRDWTALCRPIATDYHPGDQILLDLPELQVEDRPMRLIEEPETALLGVRKPIGVIRFCLPRLKHLLRLMCEQQNPQVLLCLVRLWQAVSLAANRAGFESLETRMHADQIAEKIKVLLSFRWIGRLQCFHRVFLPKLFWPPSEYYDDDENSSSILWAEMHAFEACTPLRTCLNAELKCVFATPAVSALMTDLFCKNIAGSSR